MRVQRMNNGSDPPTYRRLSMLTAIVAVVTASPAAAQVGATFVPPASTQFDITGFIQAATLDLTCAGANPLPTPPLTGGQPCGGTVTVNGHLITIPKNTIVIFPAAAWSWQEVFDNAPAPYGPTQSGLALADIPTPLSTYEVHVTGNRVNDQYIAGLVHIAQQDLNSGAGYINWIDYTVGELRIGGKIGDPTTGARVRINDTVGRFGRVMSPDVRFVVDDANPTIASGTGFPMCFPRVDPTKIDPATGQLADDPLCPQGNRPVDPTTGVPQMTFYTNDPTLVGGNVLPSAFYQAPLEIGDYVTFAGTLVKDAPAGGFLAGDGPTAGPMTSTTTTYISAHTIINNTAIYTAPGTSPVYVSVDTSLIGTGGLTVLGAGEATIRTRFEGITTDPTRQIHLFAVDVNADGSTTDRDFGTIYPDPGPPAGAVKGRWRFRPPCLAYGSTPTKPDKECVYGPSGTFLPPPRELRALVVNGDGSFVFNAPITASSPTTANGIVYGQYHAPINEYIFPENIPGTAVVENNFNAIQFLTNGGYTSSGGTVAGVLSPWPSNVVPTPACTPPTASTGGPYSVATNGSITLTGSATGTATGMTFSWTVTAGALSSTTTASTSYTAPATASTATVTLTATNGCGSNTATSTINVTQGAPTLSPIASVTVYSGTNVSLTATGSNLTGGSFVWTQTGGAPLASPNPINTSTTSNTLAFTPLLAPGQLQDVLTFSVVYNTPTATSNTVTVSVTVNPVPDVVSITPPAKYRIGKQRLDLTATSNVISPNVVLTLQPYTTTTGTTFDPTASLGSAQFTNTGNGLYTLTLVGCPEPAPGSTLTVTSNLGGKGTLLLSTANYIIKS